MDNAIVIDRLRSALMLPILGWSSRYGSTIMLLMGTAFKIPSDASRGRNIPYVTGRPQH